MWKSQEVIQKRSKIRRWLILHVLCRFNERKAFSLFILIGSVAMIRWCLDTFLWNVTKYDAFSPKICESVNCYNWKSNQIKFVLGSYQPFLCEIFHASWMGLMNAGYALAVWPEKFTFVECHRWKLLTQGTKYLNPSPVYNRVVPVATVATLLDQIDALMGIQSCDWGLMLCHSI